MLHGEYRFWRPGPSRLILSPHHWLGEPDFVIPNRLTDEGRESMLKAIVRDVFDIAGGGNFYFGLCNQTPDDADDLSAISSEPTSAGGYARIAKTRDATGWPILVDVNGHKGIRTATITFSASGADFSAPISRAFMTDASTGTSGVLYGYSGALLTPITLPDGQSLPFQYTLYMN